MQTKEKYTVYFLTPYATWRGVKAASGKKATAKCPVPKEYDPNEGPSRFVALREGDSYTVYFLTPYASWEGVEAANENRATIGFSAPPQYDANEGPSMFVAVKEDQG